MNQMNQTNQRDQMTRQTGLVPDVRIVEAPRAEMVFPQPASSIVLSTISYVLASLGAWLVVARADPDHGWKSVVGYGAVF